MTPLLFWAAWYLTPELIGREAILWIVGCLVAFAALEAYLFQRITALHEVGVLDTKERERLHLKIRDYKKRIFRICLIGMFSILVLWVPAMLGLPMSAPGYSAAAGFLVVVCLSYIVLAPAWLSEIHDFISEAHERGVLIQRRSEELAKLEV